MIYIYILCNADPMEPTVVVDYLGSGRARANSRTKTSIVRQKLEPDKDDEFKLTLRNKNQVI